VNFGPEEIKQAIQRGELKRFSKQDLANAMQVATQAGKQDVSEAPAGYKEIEFVCVNPQFPDATDPALQKKMYRGLKQIDGVVPLWQEWGDYSKGQASLSAIYQGSKNRDKILSLAKQLGVEVDLEQAVSDDYVDRAMRGEHEGQQGMAEGLTEYKNTPLQDYNGLQFMIDSNHPYLRVEAFAPGSGQQLAQVDFKIDDQDELHPEDLHVEERWRGQGIAQIMYDFVKSKGYTIHRSWSQTDAGSEFWNKHRGQKRVWEQGVAEGKQPGQPVVDAILKVMPIAQEIWFHGSRATTSHRKNSDTDILVIVPDDLVGDQYLGAVRILQKLSSIFDNYDIQPTKSGTNIHRIAQEEGRLLWSNKQAVAENFADGRNPQDKGDSKRHGINTKASVSSLRKTAKQGGRKGQLAHWLANMKSGRAKKK
jgi:predicted nucleotidyltransferase